MTREARNMDGVTVSSFGDEWLRFDQSALSESESRKVFERYFGIFPWHHLPDSAEGFDMGCGTGRWARWVSQRVDRLHCIDPSPAIDVAHSNLAGFDNVTYHRGSVGEPVLPSCSQDFGYSLGVLHHVPDTEAAIRACVDLLKPGAPLLLYLYYSFDNRGPAYRVIWRVSDIMRRLISRLPGSVKHVVTDVVAATVYLPFSKLSGLLEKMGLGVSGVPLSFYRRHSFYTMRTDARDRFGTPLEHRFSKAQIRGMMERSGLGNICFSDSAPYWCVVGNKQ